MQISGKQRHRRYTDIQFSEICVQKFTLARCTTREPRRWFQTSFPTFFMAFYGPTIAIQYVLYYPRHAARVHGCGVQSLLLAGLWL
jgi:hypothetical protein